MDGRWEQMAGCIRTVGDYKVFSIAVKLKNGLLAEQTTRVPNDELELYGGPYYQWTLNQLVETLSERVAGKV